jgi:hypothetical protein
MASYPTSVKTFTTRSPGQTIGSAHINEIQDEVNALEAGLLNGTAPLNSSNSTVANLVVTGGSTLGNVVAGSIHVEGGSTLGGAVVFKGVIDVTLANGDNHDLNPAGLSSAFAIRLTANSSGSTLTGIAAPTVGRTLILLRASATAIGLKNDAGSGAANRLQMRTNSDTGLVYSMFWYDNASNRWLQLS